MKKKNLFTGILLATAMTIIGSTSLFANEDVNSGRKFGEHVKQHNAVFSGIMNPGDHKGYSTLKR